MVPGGFVVVSAYTRPDRLDEANHHHELEHHMTTTTSLRRSTARLAAAAALALGGTVALAAPAFAGGPPSPGFYVDGELYRTVGTPTDFSGTGAPDDTFDVIYAIAGAEFNVAEAKPGDRDFNGGRWQVHSITSADLGAAIAEVDDNDSGTLDSAEEVEAAITLGLVTDEGVVRSFECPVIPLNRA